MTMEFLPTPIGGPVHIPDWEAIAARRATTLSPNLAEALVAAGDLAARNRALLLAGDALCVTTGQQPGLFLGPLFTMYKALSAVALAAGLQHRLERPVVPVFWVAGDDHDFLEAAEHGRVTNVVIRVWDDKGHAWQTTPGSAANFSMTRLK